VFGEDDRILNLFSYSTVLLITIFEIRQFQMYHIGLDLNYHAMTHED
jgi:hypothetical protein